jgi:hypothetical protein
MATSGSMDRNDGALMQRTQVTTDAAGNVTWTYATPYAAAPRVTHAVGPTADAALTEARITSLTATAVTLHVRRSPSVVILGISVLQVPQPAVGVPVQLHAFPQ